MTVHFDFDESELKLAREALAKNGITNPEKQNERIKQAQETGKISILHMDRFCIPYTRTRTSPAPRPLLKGCQQNLHKPLLITVVNPGVQH